MGHRTSDTPKWSHLSVTLLYFLSAERMEMTERLARSKADGVRLGEMVS